MKNVIVISMLLLATNAFAHGGASGTGGGGIGDTTRTMSQQELIKAKHIAGEIECKRWSIDSTVFNSCMAKVEAKIKKMS